MEGYYMVSQWGSTIKPPKVAPTRMLAIWHKCDVARILNPPKIAPVTFDATMKEGRKERKKAKRKKERKKERKKKEKERKDFLYGLATSKVMSGQVPNCDRVHSW